ncbi:hypothetical protein MYX76_09590 [Desulfobacterota bacterium AH_259_B03_O07]|nr:hypothetical protein [Desulfobacterota bacterium AH_259_B03_O07]
MRSIILIITGVVLAVIGVFTYGDLWLAAKVFLNASFLGNNIGEAVADTQRIGVMALVGSGALIIGLILAIIGVRDYTAQRQEQIKED